MRDESRPSFGDSNWSKEIRRKQETSFAHRLWILQFLYQKTLEGEDSSGGELSEKLNLEINDVVTECDILKRLFLITVEFYSTDGQPVMIKLTGTAISQIESAPIIHYDILEEQVKEIQIKGEDQELKKLDLKILKQETNLKKWEVWLNVTASIKNASIWFSTIFGSG